MREYVSKERLHHFDLLTLKFPGVGMGVVSPTSTTTTGVRLSSDMDVIRDNVLGMVLNGSKSIAWVQ